MVENVPGEDEVESGSGQVQLAFTGKHEADVDKPFLLHLFPDEIQVFLLDVDRVHASGPASPACKGQREISSPRSDVSDDLPIANMQILEDLVGPAPHG